MGSKKNTNLRNTYHLRIQISMMLISLALVFLCLVSRSIADCEYDSNLPCECTNPFVGTEKHFLGDPKRNCASAKACYVKNISGCKDIKQSKGGNRCQSNLACEPSEPAPPKPTDAPSVPTTDGCSSIDRGSQICECKDKTPPCDECEVDRNADCNDLKKCGDKCFSTLACDTRLLFEEELNVLLLPQK